MKIRSIQTRLLMVLLPLVMIALCVLAGSSYYLSKESLSKNIGQTAMAVGMDYSQRVQSDMETMIAQLKDLASVAQISAGADKAQSVAIMAETQKRLGKFDVLVLIAADGSGITSAGATASYADRDYFKKVMASQKAMEEIASSSQSLAQLAIDLRDAVGKFHV